MQLTRSPRKKPPWGRKICFGLAFLLIMLFLQIMSSISPLLSDPFGLYHHWWNEIRLWRSIKEEEAKGCRKWRREGKTPKQQFKPDREGGSEEGERAKEIVALEAVSRKLLGAITFPSRRPPNTTKSGIYLYFRFCAQEKEKCSPGKEKKGWCC